MERRLQAHGQGPSGVSTAPLLGSGGTHPHTHNLTTRAHTHVTGTVAHPVPAPLQHSSSTNDLHHIGYVQDLLQIVTDLKLQLSSQQVGTHQMMSGLLYVLC
jgi:hypothetical protein